MSATEGTAGAHGIEVQVGVSVDALVGIKRRSDAEVRKNFPHRSAQQTDRASLRREGEVFDAPATRSGILHQLADGWASTKVFGEVHREHVAGAVIGDALVPPAHRLLGGAGPCVDVPRQGGVGTEAEVDGHVGVSFVNPEVFVRVQRVVKQVLKLVGEDGFAPSEGDVGEIDEDRLSRRGKGRCEVAAGVVSAIDVVDDDLDLTVVVHIGGSEPSPVLVVLPVVRGHGRVDGGVPRACEVVEHGR